jgi:transaldolase
MKFFVDTADVEEIRSLAETGFVDGVTTNPTLVAQSGRRFEEAIAEICSIIPGPVSAEVTATDLEGMLKEGRALAKIASNVVIKVPLTPEGLKACRALTQEGTLVNVTLCFSAAQAILAAKAGASFISPFIGRLDDVGETGMDLVHQIVQIYSNFPEFHTQVLAASIRGPHHVIEAARIGADIVTIPPKVLRQLYKHPLTDKGLSDFLSDWKKTGQKIIGS